MSKMIAIRLDEGLLEGLEKERKKAGLTRARAIREAVRHWVERARYDDAVREEHEAYRRTPVTADEFGPLLKRSYSAVNLHHLATLPRSGLRRYVGTVSPEIMDQIREALLFALGFAAPLGGRAR